MLAHDRAATAGEPPSPRQCAGGHLELGKLTFAHAGDASVLGRLIARVETFEEGPTQLPARFFTSAVGTVPFVIHASA